jgi:2-hydroxychromene-2-carboxylate isomerase
LPSRESRASETKYHCLFEFHPISSVELMEMRGSSPFQGLPQSGQYDWSYRRTDVERWAAYYGVPFVEPKPPPTDHRLMAKACYAAGLQGALRAYGEALFRAIFVESHQIDAERCVALCAHLNLDPQRFAADLESEKSVVGAQRKCQSPALTSAPKAIPDEW